MAVLPPEIAYHLWKDLTIRERPIGRGKPCIRARNNSARDYQNKCHESGEDQETMKTDILVRRFHFYENPADLYDNLGEK